MAEQTARERFTLGQRVRESAAYPRVHPRAPRAGVVVGFGRQPHLVRVRRDGSAGRGSQGIGYHMDYWEPEAADGR